MTHVCIFLCVSVSRVAFRLVQVLALHGLPVCAYSVPACAYLASVFVFASLLVLADTACLPERVVLARVPRARTACICLRVPSLFRN